jgi:hypothetical protein
MRLKDSYTPEEAIKAMLHERDRWDNDCADYPDYENRVMYILRVTKEEN